MNIKREKWVRSNQSIKVEPQVLIVILEHSMLLKDN